MENEFKNIPQSMIGEKSSLIKEFLKLALKEGDSEDFATSLEKLLPKELQTTTVWFDNFTKIWRYYYGPPIDNMQSDYYWEGTVNNLPVINLYNSLKVAYRILIKDQLVSYINRLKDPSKHIDVLFEMRPVMNVGRLFKKYFEVSGYGVGNKTIDWKINFFGLNIIFDVKNRMKSLINQLDEITPHLMANATNIIPTAPNPEDLFKSVEDKFLEKKYYIQLQGVWIQTQIKEHKSILNNYFFNELNPKKVHFLIISDWKVDAYILTRNKIVNYLIKSLFRIKESERFVTEHY